MDASIAAGQFNGSQVEAIIRASQQRQKDILDKIANRERTGTTGQGQDLSASQGWAPGVDALRSQVQQKDMVISTLRQQLVEMSKQQTNASHQEAQWKLYEQQVYLREEELRQQLQDYRLSLEARTQAEAQARAQVSSLQQEKQQQDQRYTVSMSECEAQLASVKQEVERREVLRQQQALLVKSLQGEVAVVQEREWGLKQEARELTEGLEAEALRCTESEELADRLMTASQEVERVQAEQDKRVQAAVEALEQENRRLKSEARLVAELREEVGATRELSKLQARQLEATVTMVKGENERLQDLTGELQCNLDLVTERTVELEHDSERQRGKLSKAQGEAEQAQTTVREQRRSLEGLREALAEAEAQEAHTTREILSGFQGLQRMLVVAAEEGEEEVEEEEGGEEEPPRLPAPRSPQKGDKGGSVGGPVLAAPLQVQPMQEAWSSLCAAAGAVMTGLRGAREDARRQRAEGLSGAAALRVSESRLTEGGARQEGLSRELQAAMGHGRSLGDQLVVTRARAAALDTELETARGELTRLSGVEGELSDVRLYYQEAVERLSRLQSAHDSLQTELAATGDRLQGELTATQSAAVEASEAHAAEHDLLSDRVATLEGEARRSAGVLSEYRLQLASLSKGVGQMAEACRLLYRGFSPLHARYSELKAQKAYLSREHGKYITLQGETEHLMAALTGTRARYSRREGRRTRASGKALFRVSICCVLAAHRMQRGGREGGFGKGVASTAPSRQQLFLLPERAVSVDASLPVCDVTSPTSSGKSLLRLLEHLTPDHAFGHSLTSGLIPPLHLARSNRKGLGGEQGEQGAVAVIRRISLQLATRVGELERSEATLYQQFNKAQTDLTQSHQRADTLNNSYQVSSATAVRLESRVAELMNETMTMVEPEQLERAVDEVETLQQEAEELRGETAEQREVARRLQVSLTAVTGDLQSARATAQEQAQELMSLKGYAQRKTAELESLKQQSRETAAQLQAARRAVDGAAVTSNATGTRLQATERDLSEERSHLQRSQEENLVLEGKLHRMDSERLELEVTLNEKSRELYKVRQMLSTILPDDEGYPVYDEEPVA